MQARFSIVEREQARASLKLAVVLSRVIYHQFGFHVTQNSQFYQTKFSKALRKILKLSTFSSIFPHYRLSFLLTHKVNQLRRPWPDVLQHLHLHCRIRPVRVNLPEPLVPATASPYRWSPGYIISTHDTLTPILQQKLNLRHVPSAVDNIHAPLSAHRALPRLPHHINNPWPFYHIFPF